MACIDPIDPTDPEIIVTLRDFQVMERIKNFIAQHKLDPRVAPEMLRIMTQLCWPFQRPLNPATQTLLFDEKTVDNGFLIFDISRMAKAPPPAPTPATPEPPSTVQSPSEPESKSDSAGDPE